MGSCILVNAVCVALYNNFNLTLIGTHTMTFIIGMLAGAVITLYFGGRK